MQYQLHEPLACGRFGTVYRATNNKNRTLHAVKRLPKARQDVPKHKNDAMIKNEMGNWATVSHKSPYILDLQEVIEDEHDSQHVVLLVSDYCSGGTLQDTISKHKISMMENHRKLEIIRQIALAMDTMHSLNVLHGDIKPSNILFSGALHNAGIRICDFGSSTRCKDAVSGGSITWMTPMYMPPETLQAIGSVGYAADVWALGIISYQLVFDQHPFVDEDTFEDFHSILTRSQTLTKRWPSVCLDVFKDIISGCLVCNPARRKSAKDVLKIIDNYSLAGE